MTAPSRMPGPYLLLAAALAAGVAGGAGTVLIWRAVEEPRRSVVTSAGCAVDQVAQQALPSVVTINAQGPGGAGVGSGVVVTIAGAARIVTNEHVISTAAGGKVAVTYTDGHSTTAKIVGADALTDLAVVQPDDPSRSAKPIEVTDSGDLRVGRPVVALGSPLGLTSTVTSGIVSATDRYVRLPGEGASSTHLIGAIQTDAAINPGNSGGALVDCSARLIGINTAGASPSGDAGSSGLGFAIPTALMQPIAAELAERGEIVHPSLGLQVQEISDAVAAQAGVPAGLFVQAVRSGGPAARAGLRAGDIIVELDGKPVRSPEDLVRAELSAEVGQTVQIAYERAGARATAAVVAERVAA
ncbi:S1C family serine protease [Paractinoplanes lichenicola]|uniref:Trypsin-like peptidase domain-containing protein n=1 Tax=Paractinoplanes lichenicola TaxID=2802976 RepID=A0ABS1W0I1_9ACTN|nr:trypsin-like peptidase domain-containing protein [Actinoplanes lichenicola]MBL7260073.1 trypsin-like peptidase domain-containing protein [Actinoplanes lichenicola]